MSGVIVGFWKNRKVEKISPWLLSLLLMFATVPFLGPTRMNTQVFVTVYYAFILGCVASLITLPADEAGDYDNVEDQSLENAKTAEETETASGVFDVISPEQEKEDVTETPESETSDSEIPGSETADSETPESEAADSEAPESETSERETSEPGIAPEPEEAAPEPVTEKLFIPAGMVLPMDDEDADLTPRMKMPEPTMPVGADGRVEKLHINRPEPEFEYIPEEKSTETVKSYVVEATLVGIADAASGVPKYIDEYSVTDGQLNAASPLIKQGDDFDITLKPGDDFDI